MKDHFAGRLKRNTNELPFVSASSFDRRTTLLYFNLYLKQLRLQASADTATIKVCDEVVVKRPWCRHLQF
jgi:hypothetical protein